VWDSTGLAAEIAKSAEIRAPLPARGHFTEFRFNSAKMP
jgi:hypothetical protein